MKIIAGLNKGRHLKVSKKGIRPTKAIVREAIFDILGNRIADAKVLDIFAGSGALGIEAICRGAKSCIFIEKSPRILLENIKNFSLADKTKVIIGDFRAGLRKLKNNQFTIIFVDPPYKKGYVITTLDLIAKYKLLYLDGIIMVEHSSLNKFELSENFSIYKQKHYGETAISFIAK